MPGTRLTARERVGRTLGVARRLVRTATQRVRRRGGGGEVEAERAGDIVREVAGRIRRRRR